MSFFETWIIPCKCDAVIFHDSRNRCESSTIHRTMISRLRLDRDWAKFTSNNSQWRSTTWLSILCALLLRHFISGVKSIRLCIHVYIFCLSNRAWSTRVINICRSVSHRSSAGCLEQISCIRCAITSRSDKWFLDTPSSRCDTEIMSKLHT